jgi:hypothetical protein
MRIHWVYYMYRSYDTVTIGRTQSEGEDTYGEQEQKSGLGCSWSMLFNNILESVA